jgi:precorrin-2 dehydrogenase/sirohydrochlorin ferrochelatase
MSKRYFPAFVDSKDRRVVVAGGGRVAGRRIRTLKMFEFEVTVVAPELTEELAAMAEKGEFRFVQEKFQPEMAEDAGMVLACTDDRDLNRRTGEYCRSRGIAVNVCDAREESTFWFPAVAVNDQLTVGLVGSGDDHEETKRAAAGLREIVKRKAY